MSPRRLTLGGVLCLGLAAIPARAAPVAILPVDAPAGIVPSLEARLDGLEPARALSPRRTRAALAQRQPALEAAAGMVRAAEEAGLRMERSAALAQADRALALLDEQMARFSDRALVARALAARAFALLLAPRDEAGAAEAFHSALEVSSGFDVDRDRLSPRVAQVLGRARAEWETPRPPPAPALRRLAAALGVREQLWLAVRRAGDAPSPLRIEVVVFDAAGQPLRRRGIDSVARAELEAGAARLVEEVLAPPRPSAATTRTAPSRAAVPVPAPAPARAERPRPWYRKWWVWTVVGVGLGAVGAGVALAVTSRGRSSPERYDLEFRF